MSEVSPFVLVCMVYVIIFKRDGDKINTENFINVYVNFAFNNWNATVKLNFIN